MIEAAVTIVFAALGGVIWLVRLEGKVKNNEEANSRTQADVDDLRARFEMINSELVKELTQIRVAIAKIEGILERSHKEARSE